MDSITFNNKITIITRSGLMRALARGYTSKENKKKIVDEVLINAMVEELIILINQYVIESQMKNIDTIMKGIKEN